MKSSHRLTGIVAALAAVCFVATLAPQPARAQANEETPRVAVVDTPVIVVKGVGNKTVQTERTSLGIAASVESSTLHGAIDALQTELASIREAIEEAGAGNFEVSEWQASVSDYLNTQDERVYNARSGLEIVTPTLARAAEFINALEATGHLVSNIRFARVDHRSYSQDAYALAIEDAIHKAGEIAAATGMRIGRLVRMEPESLNSTAVRYPFRFNIGGLSSDGPHRGMGMSRAMYELMLTLHETFGPPEAIVTAEATYIFELLEAD